MTEKLIESGLGIASNLAEKILENIGSQLSSKPLLICRLYYTPKSELIDRSKRTKYSDSEYGLEIINVGDKTFLIDRFALWSKKSIIINMCEVTREDSCIEPNKSIIFTFSQQDAETLCYHCHKSNLKTCDVHILSIDGKTINVKLDVYPITLQMSPIDETAIIE